MAMARNRTAIVLPAFEADEEAVPLEAITGVQHVKKAWPGRSTAASRATSWKLLLRVCGRVGGHTRNTVTRVRLVQGCIILQRSGNMLQLEMQWCRSQVAKAPRWSCLTTAACRCSTTARANPVGRRCPSSRPLSLTITTLTQTLILTWTLILARSQTQWQI